MANHEKPDVEDRPAKRFRVEEPAEQEEADADDQSQRERRACILSFANPKAPGFSGVLKQRCD